LFAATRELGRQRRQVALLFTKLRNVPSSETGMKTRILWAGLLVLLSASSAAASPISIPAGLAAGSTYFLTFVTSDTHDALSSDIAAYDAFVTAEADMDPTLAALNTTWRVIGSTATVDAIDHAGVTGPVYNTRGEMVATGAGDMFDGTLDTPIVYTQSGIDLQAAHLLVWSGSNAQGIGIAGQQLGATQVTAGDGDVAFHAWLDGIGGSPLPAVLPAESTLRYYAVSGPLVVRTPEASSVALTMVPMLLMFALFRRRGRQCPAEILTVL
jgi:hypothetical protein